MTEGEGPRLGSLYPRAIAERIIRCPEDADRHFVETFTGTVVLVDMVAFTAFTETLTEKLTEDSSSEALLRILNEYLGRIAETITGCGGDIITYAGDAVQAVWRAGSDPGLAAHRAADACIALRDLVVTPEGGEPIKHRISAASGTFHLASVGSRETSWDHILLGDPVGDADTAQRAAKPGEILLDTATWRLVASYSEGERHPAGWARLNRLHRPAVEVNLANSHVADELERALRGRGRRFVADSVSANRRDWLEGFRPLTSLFVKPGAVSAGRPSIQDLLAFAAAIHPVVARFDGAVDKMLADHAGLQCSIAFGLPYQAHTHGSSRAIGAAFAILEALRKHGFTPHIGIASGRIFCGLCGSPARRQYMMYGRAINVAARLMQSGASEIVCGESVTGEAGTTYRFERLPAIRLKGIDGPVWPFRPSPSDQTKSPLQPIVGRDKEQALLNSALVSLKQGRGSAFGLVGESGIGKTRILSHLEMEASASGVRTIRMAGGEFARMDPYLPWRPFLSQLLGVDSSPERLREAVNACFVPGAGLEPDIRDHILRLGSFAPLLNEIMPVGIEETETTELVVGKARAETLQNILVFLVEKAAAKSPLVVVIDDAQWLDPSSSAAMAKVIRVVPNLLVVAASRPPAEKGNQPFAELDIPADQTINLAGLPRQGSQALVAVILKAAASEALITFVHDRAEGNPFYTEELVKTLKESGVVKAEKGRVAFFPQRLGKEAKSLPDSLREVVFGRVEGLPPPAQMVLRVASIVGRPFSMSLLREAFAKVPEQNRFDELLTALVEKDFIRPSTSGELVYDFKHAIVREVVYDAMPIAAKRPLHLDLGRWLERQPDVASGLYWAELAHHWEHANRLKRAVHYLDRAAQRAHASYGNRECADFLTRAKQLSLAQRQRIAPRKSARWERYQRDALPVWERSHGDALHGLSDFDKATERYISALHLVGVAVPTRRSRLMAGTLWELLVQTRNRLIARGRTSTAGAVAHQAIAAHSYARLSEESFFQGKAASVVHQTLAAINRAERANAAVELMNGYGALAIGLSIAGMPSIARYYNGLAQRLASRTNNDLYTAFVRLLTMVLATGLGDWARVKEYGQQTSDVFLKYGDGYRWHLCQSLRFFGHYCAGEFGAADAVLSQSRAVVDANTPGQIQVWTHSSQVLQDLLTGQPDGASVDAIAELIARQTDETMELTAKFDRSTQMLCYGILAVAYLRQQDEARAREAALSGLRILTTIDPIPGGGFLYAADGIAEVLATLSEQAGSRGRAAMDHAREARSAARVLKKFGRRLPTYRPFASLAAARLATLRPTTRSRLLQQSAEAAQSIGMQHQMARAELEIARGLAPDDPLRISRLVAVQETFRRLGATFDADGVRRFVV